MQLRIVKTQKLYHNYVFFAHFPTDMQLNLGTLTFAISLHHNISIWRLATWQCPRSKLLILAASAYKEFWRGRWRHPTTLAETTARQPTHPTFFTFFLFFLSFSKIKIHMYRWNYYKCLELHITKYMVWGFCDGLATCPGCTPPLAKWQLG